VTLKEVYLENKANLEHFKIKVEKGLLYQVVVKNALYLNYMSISSMRLFSERRK